MMRILRGASYFVLCSLVALLCSSVRADMVVSWSMETETPEFYPSELDSRPHYSPVPGSYRTADQAHGGQYSLDLSGDPWMKAGWSNPTNNQYWASPQQGAVELWWMFTGQLQGSEMLMMIDGLYEQDPSLDSNDGVAVRFHGSSELTMEYGSEGGDGWKVVRIKYNQSFVPNQWYKLTAKWNTATAPYMYLQIDDNAPATGSAQPGQTKAVAWHHLMVGNDRNVAPEGLFIDDFRLWDDYAMTPEPGSCILMLLGAVASLGKGRRRV